MFVHHITRSVSVRQILMVVMAAALALPGQMEAQGPVKWSWSGFGGVMKVEDYDDLAFGYGLSLRRMKEGSSLDLAVDLASYAFPTLSDDYGDGSETKTDLSSIGLTGSLIYQKPGSPWQVVGGAGYYNFNINAKYFEYGDELGSESLETDPELGYHIGLGRRLGNKVAIEARYVDTKFSYSFDGEQFSDKLRMLTVFGRFTLF